MTYPENLSLVELAQYYVNYRGEEVLNELARRDKLNQITCDEQRFEESDNQKLFDFHKEVASAKEVANNGSVEAEAKWEEAYEAGFRAGTKAGEKKAFVQAGLKIERVL